MKAKIRRQLLKTTVAPPDPKPPADRPGEWRNITHAKKRAWLTAYALAGSVKGACEATGVPRRTHDHWMQHDPEFKLARGEALEDAIEVLEDEARRRAKVGSDLLLIFLLKAHRPERYRDRYEVTGAGGGPLFAPGFPIPDTGNPPATPSAAADPPAAGPSRGSAEG